MPNGLRCFTEKLVLGFPVPWFWTLGFVLGGLVVQPCAASAAFLVVISLGRRPAGVAGGGAARRVGEPRRGAPVADRFAVLHFAQAVELSPVFGSSTTGNFYRKEL